MKLRMHRILVAALAAVVPFATSLRADEEDRQKQQKQIRVIVRTADDGDKEPSKQVERIVVVGGDEDELPGYWIGVMGTPIDQVLKKHLKLDGGLLIEQVVDDSPAAKAGLETDDILLRFGEFHIANLEDLVGAIREVNGSEVKMVVLRAGDKKTLEIQPAKRPKDLTLHIEKLETEPEMDVVREWLGKLQKGEIGDAPAIMKMMPGVIIGRGKLDGDPLQWREFEFPKNTQISISKSDGDTKITVRRGDNEWTVTEETLDELPKDLQKAVRQMLGQVGDQQMLRGFQFRGIPKMQGERPREFNVEIPEIPRLDVDKKLDAIRKEMEALRRELKSMREKSKKETSAPKKTERKKDGDSEV